MKRIALLICTLLLVATTSLAWMNIATTTGSGGSAAPPAGLCGAGCTGNLVFCWGMDADFINGSDITLSDGCSAGDVTVTFNSGVSGESAPGGVGGYAIYVPTASDYVSFSISGDDIATDTAGTIMFDIYVTTLQESIVARFYASADDFIQVALENTDEVEIVYEGNNVQLSVVTTAANLQLNTWYTITAKWRQGASDPSLSITANGSTATTNTDLTDFANALSSTWLGGYSALNHVLYMKNIRIWKSWQ